MLASGLEAPLPQADRFSTRVFGLAIVAALAYLLFHIFAPFLAPIYWAFLLAFMLFPITVRVRRRVGGRKGLGAALLTLGVLLGIAVPAAIGVFAFARQAVELGRRVSAAAQQYQIEGIGDVLKIPVLGGMMGFLKDRFHVDASQIQGWLVAGSQRAVQFLLARSGEVLFGALGILGNLALMLFILFFYFRDGDTLAARARNLIPLDPKRKERLVRNLQSVTRAVVFGTVVTALVQGALLGIGFWITGLPSPVVFGVLSAVASFVPLIGTALIWVPASLYLFAQGVLWKTVFLAAWSALVVGSADNFLRPMLVSGKSQIGTLTVFFGGLGGLAAFGFIGLFLGPVILALALTLIEFAEEGQREAAESGAKPPAG